MIGKYTALAQSMSRKEMIALQARMEAREEERRVYAEQLLNLFHPTPAERMTDRN